jgi:superfamily II DNA or RNA helicase
MISEAYYRAIQKAALPGVWSKGVALAQQGAVIVDSEAGDEIRFRVRVSDRPVSPKVTLWPESEPEDREWHCDCGDRNELCMHIAATAVALKTGKAVKSGTDESHPGAGGLEYRFVKQDRALTLERWIVRGEKKEKLVGSLVSHAGGIGSGRIAAAAVPATREDFSIDQIITSFGANASISGLFKHLKECPSVFYNEQPVKVSTATLRPRAEVVDEGAGFRLKLVRDPAITEAFANGIILLQEGVLKPWETVDLAPEQRKWLEGEGSLFGLGDAAILVSEILPGLEGKIAVEIRAQRLPRAVTVAPRLELRLEREGPEVLGVTGFLVYGDPVIAEVSDDRLVSKSSERIPVRDRAAERSLLRSLQSRLDMGIGERVKREGSGAVQFAQRVAEFTHQEPLARTIGAGAASFAVTGKLAPKILVGPDARRITIDFGGADAARVFQAWQGGESLVPLLEGGWAPLPRDWLERFGARVLALIHAKERLPSYRLPEIAALLAESGDVVPVSLGKLTERLAHFEKIPDAALPSDLRADLRGYQRQGINWLSFLRETEMGALLADDMGLGKTLQALAVVSENGRGRTLVVAPTSVLRAWQEQAERFRPGLKVALYYGGQRKMEAHADLVITSYGVLRLDQEELAAMEWDTLILDEAQTIKNPDSQVARAAHRLRGKFRIALSGTPVENHLRDLWSQFEFLNPGLLGTRQEFQENFASPIESGSAGAAQSLRRLIKPFLLRRLKREVATELPPRTETVLYCELSDSERAVYDAIFASTRAEALKALGAEASPIAVLEALLRLRQAACHPGLVPAQTAETSSKTELFIETLKESIENGHRALVFSQWTSFLDLIGTRLEREGIHFSRLDGSVPAAGRAVLVEDFQKDGGPDCMLISLKAGGVGLTLTAADHVFILDPWWNPAAEDQAADRAHRIGQDNPVLIHRLVARDTVEDRILELQKLKLGIAGAALEGSAHAVSLTREDLLALLT